MVVILLWFGIVFLVLVFVYEVDWYVVGVVFGVVFFLVFLVVGWDVYVDWFDVYGLVLYLDWLG